MGFDKPKGLRGVHRPLATKQTINGGVLQSLSGVHFFFRINESPYSAFQQVSGLALHQPRWRQPLTRSLLSGSDVSKSMRSDSEEGSCLPSHYSRTIILCSATDAASAAIDFSKGNAEEGVVDSPPSRGSGRTPVCSPSPLKRTCTPSRLCSLSPTPRAEIMPQRRLYAYEEEVFVDPCIGDGGQSFIPSKPFPNPKSSYKAELSGGDRKRKISLGAFSAGHSARPLDNPESWTSKSFRVGSPARSVPVSRQPCLQDFRRSNDSRSTGTAGLYINTVNKGIPRPRGGSVGSISSDGISRSKRRRRNDLIHLLMVGNGGPVLSASERSRPSRREDIFRAYAKLKACEAAEDEEKNKCLTKKN